MKTAALMALVLLTAASCRKEQPATATAPAPATASTSSAAPAGEPRDMSEQKIDHKLLREPTYLESSMLGSKGADGTVGEERTKFTPGEPVYLTMKLKESPAGLQTRVEWKDASGRTIFEEQRPMNGGKVVTFELKKKLEAGGYKAIGYWGGNVACEFPFNVGAKK